LKGGTGVAAPDRLGSIGRYLPYGEERTGQSGNPANGNEKFATYTRDGVTGLDYADQRWYAQGQGRFLTSDPYQASAGPGDPASWNRYAYVQGDPTNYVDGAGLGRCLVTVNTYVVFYTTENGVTREVGRSITGSYTMTAQCADDQGVLPAFTPIQGGPTAVPMGPSDPFGFRGPNGQPGTILVNSAVPGFQLALSKLSQECVDALSGKSNSSIPDAINMLNTALIVATDLGPYTSTDGNGAFSSPAYTPGGGIVYLNTSLFFNANQVFLPPSNLAYVPQTLLQGILRDWGLTDLLDMSLEQFQALALLHELGHMLNGFPDDRNDLALGKAHNKKVIDNCFPNLRR
jgi:RHS repeat-associated protein